MTLRGETESGTIVRGSVSAGSGHFGAATIENLTIESGSTSAITVGGGEVDVIDVTVRATSGAGVSSFGGTTILSRVSFDQGGSPAIRVFRGRVDGSQVDITGHDTGISVQGGALSLADSAIATDGTAVSLGDGSSSSAMTEATIARSTLRSKSNGIDATRAQLTVRDSTIEAADMTAFRGVNVVGGTVTLTGTSVRGWSDAGLSTFWLPLLSSSDPTFESVTATLDQVEITGCRYGIWYDAGFFDGRFSMHHTRVTAAEIGVVLMREFAAADLGTRASPGDNQISVASGDVALEVFGGSPGVAVDAHGTTLNGASVDGDVQGPAELAGRYQIGASSLVHF